MLVYSETPVCSHLQKVKSSKAAPTLVSSGARIGLFLISSFICSSSSVPSPPHTVIRSCSISRKSINMALYSSYAGPEWGRRGGEEWIKKHGKTKQPVQ